MIVKHGNYAFIDAQNLHRGIKSLGWELDWVRFRVYLKEKYGVDTAYINNKLEIVISPYRKTCSVLLRKSAKEKIIFIDNLQQLLGQKKSTA